MRDVMVDIEALGNGKNCCIVQIGACNFDRETGEIGETFECNIDANGNGDIDAGTVYWWLRQADAARASILSEPRYPITIALRMFNEFLVRAGKPAIWSHATYDFVALSEAYRRHGMAPTFAYRDARDIRTLVDLAKITVSATPRDGTHHNGLDDAKHQVKYCVEAFKKLSSRTGGL